MSPNSDRLTTWRRRRRERLRALPWLRPSAAADADSPTAWYVADEVLIRREHRTLGRRVLTEQGHHPVDVEEQPDAAGSFDRYRASGLDVEATVRSVRRRASRGSLAASPNHVFFAAEFEHGGPFGPPAPVADPGIMFPRPVPRGRGPAIAVLDTGVWPDSPLSRRHYEAGRSDIETEVDVDGDGKRDGDVGHANFVTGVILQNTTNARVRVVKVLNTFGVCTEADLAAALTALTDVDIVNLSLSGLGVDDRPPGVLRDALDHVLAGNSRVLVAAAGNDRDRSRPYWPAAFGAAGEAWSDRVVAVAAHDGEGICAWSNFGPWVRLGAAGDNVTSTFLYETGFDSGWARWSGTSFATPRVVAAIAEAMRGGKDAAVALGKVLGEAAAHRYPDPGTGWAITGLP